MWGFWVLDQGLGGQGFWEVQGLGWYRRRKKEEEEKKT